MALIWQGLMSTAWQAFEVDFIRQRVNKHCLAGVFVMDFIGQGSMSTWIRTPPATGLRPQNVPTQQEYAWAGSC